MRLSGGLLALALGTALLAGCGEQATPGAATPRFDTQQVAWAHLRTLHYGDRTFTLPRRIRGLAVSDYGFFVALSDDGSLDGTVTWGFYDGREWLPLGGDPTGEVAVSADGRYVGWVNRAGPRRPAGRVREIVVADVRKGEAVLKDHSGMGGALGDDLGDRYEELSPTFLGFDADSTHAYWTDASGSGTRKRADLASGAVEVAQRALDESESGEEAVGTVVDAYRGRAAGPAGFGGPLELQNGRYSPDERFAVDLGRTGRTVVYDATRGRRVPVDLPAGAAYFAGWLPDDSFYVVSTARRVESHSLTGPDRTRGRVVVCRLPTGTCEPGDEVPGMRDVVVPGQPSLLG